MGELQRLALLPGQLDQLSQELCSLKAQVTEIPTLKAQLADLQLVIARRYDAHEEVTKLKEQLRKLTGTVVKKIEVAETEHFNHLNSELQALNALLATKVPQDYIERLEHKLVQDLQKVAFNTSSLEKLEARLGILAGDQCSRNEDVEHLGKELQGLQERADSRIADLQSRLGEMTGKMSAQDPCTVLDQLNLQYRTLSTTMSQKVDFSEMEHIKSQLNAVGDSVANKVESSISDQLRAQYRTMCAAVSSVGTGEAVNSASQSDRGGLPPLEKPFLACMDRLSALSADMQALGRNIEGKADKIRVDQLIEQFQVLVDMLVPKLSAKPKPRAPARPQSARGL